MQQPIVSVVFTTYNQPRWLEKVLWGFEAQTFRAFEVIVADDGSGDETRELLERMVPQLSFSLKHVWHADTGYRKCDILNKAILASSTDYLIFTDGDCIPRNDFVEVHHRMRRRGRFLSNGYYKLDMRMSELVTKDDILSGRCFELAWLREQGLPRTFRNNKFTRNRFKQWLLNTFTPAGATWNGHGSSAWLDDIMRANGFDMRMKYGGQDREFGERLVNAGIRGRQIRYSTVVLHLDHSRGYATGESIAANQKLRAHTRKNKVMRTPNGIAELNDV